MRTWIVLAALAVLTAYVAFIFNGLVTLRNRVRDAFSQIQKLLQRRYDLIPRLVDASQGYMRREHETLDAVITARNAALGIAQQIQPNPADATAIRTLIGAEAALAGALERFFAVSERYPDLQASHNMAQLQEELAGTENRIAYAREAYNEAVTLYNRKHEAFPASLLARAFHFKASAHWEIEAAQRRNPARTNSR